MTEENNNTNTSTTNKPENTGITRIIKAFGYSVKGYKWAFKNESAIRQETFMLVIGVVLAFVLGKNYIQYILMISSVLLVIIIELLNSSIEAVVDRIGSEYHELSGSAKDMGSCAVFISLLILFIVWIFIILHNYNIFNL